MKKIISAFGSYKKLEGYVEILEQSKTIQVHNPSTHEDDKRTVGYYLVKGVACGERFISEEIRDEDKLLSEVEKMETTVYSILLAQANQPDSSNVFEQLKQKGYTNDTR